MDGQNGNGDIGTGDDLVICPIECVDCMLNHIHFGSPLDASTLAVCTWHPLESSVQDKLQPAPLCHGTKGG